MGDGSDDQDRDDTLIHDGHAGEREGVGASADAFGAADDTSGYVGATSGQDGSVNSESVERARGRPGRPRGSNKSKKAGRGQGPVRLRVDAAPKAAKRSTAAGPTTAQAGPSGDPQQTVTALLQLAELAAVATIGPDAMIAPMERTLIEPAMVRILARMDAEAIARYAALSDPILLTIGVGLWGFRVWSVTSIRARARAEASRGTTNPPAEPGDGPGASAAPPAPDHPVNEQSNGYAPVPLAISLAMESDSTLEGI